MRLSATGLDARIPSQRMGTAVPRAMSDGDCDAARGSSRCAPNGDINLAGIADEPYKNAVAGQVTVSYDKRLQRLTPPSAR